MTSLKFLFGCLTTIHSNLNMKVTQNSTIHQANLKRVNAMKILKNIKLDLKDVSHSCSNLLDFLPKSSTAENLILHLNSLLDPSVKFLFSQNFLHLYPNLNALILIFRDTRCICQFKEALESMFASFDSSNVKDVFIVLKVNNFHEISTVKPVLQVSQPFKNKLKVYTKQQHPIRHAQVAL